VKYLYILVFGLFSFAAPAQTLETWIPTHYLAEIDCVGEMNQQGTKPSQIIGMEQFCAAMLNDADGAAITDTQDAEDIPVGSLQPTKENSTVKYLTGSDDELVANDTTERSATFTQIIVIKPTIQTLSEAKRDADGVPITEPEDAEGVLVSAVQPNEKNSTVKYSTASDDELSIDDIAEPGATSPRIIGSKPTIEYRDAKVSEVDDVMSTGPNHSENVQVGAHGDPPTVGETIE
jgi:hypothetical protein